jgi:hypothetical protein
MACNFDDGSLNGCDPKGILTQTRQAIGMPAALDAVNLSNSTSMRQSEQVRMSFRSVAFLAIWTLMVGPILNRPGTRADTGSQSTNVVVRR